MKQADIIRESLGVPLTVDSLTQSLHSQAEELLGYHCENKTNASDDSAGPLRQAITQLGIEVLNPESVVRYQSEQLAALFIARGPNMSRVWNASPEWTRHELQKYKNPVPDFAIERALQIKQACPEVKFWVEELTEAVDPFLIAWMGTDDWSVREAYYIAVWEEARFEAGL